MAGSRALFWLASVAFFMQSLDTTMLYVAIPAIARTLHQPVLRMEPVVMAYLVAVVAFTPLNSWLSQRLGERRTCQLALLTFIAGALLCSQATSAAALALCRCLQGAGGALLLPVLRTQALRATTPEQKLPFLNRMTLLGLLGTLTGPLAGSLLTDAFGWRAIFLAPIPLSLLCLWLTGYAIPDGVTPSSRRIPLRSLLLLTAALSLFTLLLVAAPKNLLPLPALTLIALAGSVCGWLYLRGDRHAREALLPASLFGIRTFYVGVWGGVLTRLLLASIPVLISLVTQTTLGLTPATAGIIMLLFSAGALLAKLLFEPLVRRAGYRQLLIAATLLAAIAVLALGAAIQQRSLPCIGALSGLLGVLTALLHSAESTLACCHLENDACNSGNNILLLSQLLAVMLSMALTFPALRALSRLSPWLHISPFSLLFALLGVGLALSCLLFRHLGHEDGNVLLSPSS
ncbi:MFS transporter [Dickeya fangzhongdai]|uniref:MFS transporter n=1 Tax=Dickeya fangzhongdai TaxID=1778540 RepID=UPI002B2D87BD|nr:MFS transporter [Dickeya fangzhongdai]